MKLTLTIAAIVGVFLVNHLTIKAETMDKYSGPEAGATRRAVRNMVYSIVVEIALIIGVAVA